MRWCSYENLAELLARQVELPTEAAPLTAGGRDSTASSTRVARFGFMIFTPMIIPRYLQSLAGNP